MKSKPCPFCGKSDSLFIRALPTQGVDGPVSEKESWKAVCCRDCGAQGPMAKEPEDAHLLWGGRTAKAEVIKNASTNTDAMPTKTNCQHRGKDTIIYYGNTQISMADGNRERRIRRSIQIEKEYKDHEFCRAQNCSALRYNDSASWCSCDTCYYSAKSLHKWLKSNGYRIMKVGIEDQKPFENGDLITYAGDKFTVLENHGDSGKVQEYPDGDIVEPFYWNYEGEKCRRVE